MGLSWRARVRGRRGSHGASTWLLIAQTRDCGSLTLGNCAAAGVGDLRTRIKQFAREAGFDLCGIAPVRDFGELQIFPSWIADGRHGEMKYMEARNEAGELKRAKLANVAPWARSVIVCAINYNTAQPYSTQTETEAERGLDFALRLEPRRLSRGGDAAAAHGGERACTNCGIAN